MRKLKLNANKNRIIASGIVFFFAAVIGIQANNIMKSNLPDHVINEKYVNMFQNGYDYKKADNSIIVSSRNRVHDKSGIVQKIAKDLYMISYDNSGQAKKACLEYDRKGISATNDGVAEIQTVDENAALDASETNSETDGIINDKIESSLNNYLEKNKPISGKMVTIAVIDTGVTETDDLKNRILDCGVNFSKDGKETDYSDDNGHGTIMSEMIAQNTTDNVKILPIKCFDKDGKGTLSSVVQAVKYAQDYGVDVINISAATTSDNAQAVKDVVNEAIKRGITVVTAAGNQNTDVKNITPANVEDAFTITSVDSNFQPSSFSNYGDVDYAAVGENELLFNPITCSYENIDGTSIAAAKVSGIAATVKTTKENINKDELTKILDSAAIKTDTDKIYIGRGILFDKETPCNVGSAVVNTIVNKMASQKAVEKSDDMTVQAAHNLTLDFDHCNVDSVNGIAQSWGTSVNWYWANQGMVIKNYLTKGKRVPGLSFSKSSAMYKSGYTFNGWKNGEYFWDENGNAVKNVNVYNTQWISNGIWNTDSSATVKAQWIENPLILDYGGVEFNREDFNSLDTTVSHPSTDSYNNEQSADSPSRASLVNGDENVVNYSAYYTYNKKYKGFYTSNIYRGYYDWQGNWQSDYTFMGWTDGTFDWDKGQYTLTDKSSNPDGNIYYGAGSHKYYAVWHHKKKYVTFDANGGTITGRCNYEKYNKTYNYEDSLPKSDSSTIQSGLYAERPGYVFTGWSIESENGNNGDVNYTYTANWRQNKNRQTVIGSVDSSVSINPSGAWYSRKTTEFIDVPKEQGLVFKGYYTGKNGQGDCVINAVGKLPSSTRFNSNTTLYAKWDPIDINQMSYCTISYDSNGGWGSDSTTISKGSGASVRNSEGFGKTGYTFSHWNTESDGSGTNYWPGDDIYPSGDIILYAQWDAADVGFKVEYYVKNIDDNEYSLYTGADGVYGGANQTAKADSDKTIWAYWTLDNGGFTLNQNMSGINPGDNSKTLKIKPDGTTVFKFYYDRNSFNVNITGDDGIESTSGGGAHLYGSEVTINAGLVDRYKWSSWSGDIRSDEQEYSFKMPAKDLNIKANSYHSTYTLTVVPLDKNDSGSNNAYWKSPDSDKQKEYSKGTTWTCELDKDGQIDLEDPVREGYTFESWDIIPKDKDGGTLNGHTFTMGNVDTTVVAKWTPNATTKYVVNYFFQNEDLNGWTKDEAMSGEFSGVTDSYVRPKVYSVLDENFGDRIYGFKMPKSNSKQISPDGKMVINYYYYRYLVKFEYSPGHRESINNNDKYGDYADFPSNPYLCGNRYLKVENNRIVESTDANGSYKNIITKASYGNNIMKLENASKLGLQLRGYSLDYNSGWKVLDATGNTMGYLSTGYENTDTAVKVIENMVNKYFDNAAQKVTADMQDDEIAAIFNNNVELELENPILLEANWSAQSYEIRIEPKKLYKVKDSETGYTDTRKTDGTKTIYEWYDHGFYSDSNCINQINNLPELAQRTGYKLEGYFTKDIVDEPGSYEYQNRGKKIISGEIVDDADKNKNTTEDKNSGKILVVSTYFSADTTIYAHWRDTTGPITDDTYITAETVNEDGTKDIFAKATSEKTIHNSKQIVKRTKAGALIGEWNTIWIQSQPTLSMHTKDDGSGIYKAKIVQNHVFCDKRFAVNRNYLDQSLLSWANNTWPKETDTRNLLGFSKKYENHNPTVSPSQTKESGFEGTSFFKGIAYNNLARTGQEAYNSSYYKHNIGESGNNKGETSTYYTSTQKMMIRVDTKAPVVAEAYYKTGTLKDPLNNTLVDNSSSAFNANGSVNENAMETVFKITLSDLKDASTAALQGNSNNPSDVLNQANLVKEDVSGIKYVWVEVSDPDKNAQNSEDNDRYYILPLKSGYTGTDMFNGEKKIYDGTFATVINLYKEFPKASRLEARIYACDGAGNTIECTDKVTNDPDNNPAIKITNYSITSKIIRNDKEAPDTIYETADGPRFLFNQSGKVHVTTYGYVQGVDVNFPNGMNAAANLDYHKGQPKRNLGTVAKKVKVMNQTEDALVDNRITFANNLPCERIYDYDFTVPLYLNDNDINKEYGVLNNTGTEAAPLYTVTKLTTTETAYKNYDKNIINNENGTLTNLYHFPKSTALLQVGDIPITDKLRTHLVN